jgi:hypothetical protein
MPRPSLSWVNRDSCGAVVVVVGVFGDGTEGDVDDFLFTMVPLLLLSGSLLASLMQFSSTSSTTLVLLNTGRGWSLLPQGIILTLLGLFWLATKATR